MKIISFVYSEKGPELVLRGDSSLLNGHKPLFIPDWTKELAMTPCMVLRVSRLGKEVGLKYAERYYDAVAFGADFVALDLLREAQAAGRPWTQAFAFDYSLALGEWMNVPSDKVQWTKNHYVLSPEEAVVEASKWMTIRQVDLITIQEQCAPKKVQKEEIIRVEIDGEEKLYCKIK